MVSLVVPILVAIAAAALAFVLRPQPVVALASAGMRVTMNGVDHVATTGFYANAYRVGDKIVVPYRGTDNPAEDWWSGWPIGLGVPANQASGDLNGHRGVRPLGLGNG